MIGETRTPVAPCLAVVTMLKLRGIKISGLALSLVLHSVTGVALAFFHFRHQAADLTASIESIFSVRPLI